MEGANWTVQAHLFWHSLGIFRSTG